MFLQHKKLVLSGMIPVLLLLLVACSSAGGNSINGNTGTSSTRAQGLTPAATATAIITPQLVTPKAARGSAGKGPVVISSPTPVPGGKAGSQQIVLGDRILIINSASKQRGPSANSTLITLDLGIRNTSGKAIMNQSTFFQLMATEGDTFGYQANGFDNFYGTIAAHTTRSG
ncbi:MAG TPA: hypothetical protein VEL31_11945, partial [Ktedonobacteraceae bacterium]|nr:hypothetical protein [Ktedonobacteraceae bacterium]